MDVGAGVVWQINSLSSTTNIVIVKKDLDTLLNMSNVTMISLLDPLIEQKMS